MSTPRRRPTSGIRRPRVAGRPTSGPTGHDEPEQHDEHDDPRPGGVTVEERAAADDLTAAPPVRSGPGSGSGSDRDRSPGSAPDPDAGPGDGDDAPAPRVRLRPPAAPTSRSGIAALLVATVLLTAAAAFFGYSWYRTEFTGPAANTALTDVGATAEVSRDVGEAVTKVYSFDHARLDQAESDAAAVVTPEFRPEFERIFGSVRELAPQQQAVVTATIPKSAVASITGDRATVYLFVNQVIRRQAADGPPQEGAAAARLRIDARHVDGRWKIAAMTPA